MNAERLGFWKTIKLYAWAAQYNVRDVAAAILQDLARWIAP